MKINFTETGWRDYLYWEGQDKLNTYVNYIL